MKIGLKKNFNQNKDFKIKFIKNQNKNIVKK